MRSSPSRWAWLAAGVLVAVYAAYYGQQLWRWEAVPTFDQAAYVSKTWAIADVLWHPIDHAGRLFLPSTYLGPPEPDRPPLMMIVAAAIGGPDVQPKTIGLIWLLARLAILLLAMRQVQKLVGDLAGGWWIPAAVAAVLAGASNHLLYPNLYMMDTTFEAFGLLVTACLAADLIHRNARTAIPASAATVALLMVKPAALVFVFPLYLLLLWCVIDQWRQKGELARWLWPYAVMVVVIIALLVSPYGQAAWRLYRLGMTGYWASENTLGKLLMALFTLCPLWILLPAGVAAWRRRGGWSPAQRMFLLAALVTAAWWFVFNAFITFMLDPRIVAAAMPVAVTAGVLVMVRWRPGLVLLPVLMLMASMASALGYLPPNVLLPPPQSPAKEVGLRELSMRLSFLPANGPTRAVHLLMLCHDDFVENSALRVAVRQNARASYRGPGRVEVTCAPWGTGGLDLHALFADPNSRWRFVLTKHRRRGAALQGDVWMNQEALHALVQDPGSPWNGKFQPVFTQDVHQPDLLDQVTVWDCPEPLTAADIAAGYAYILPRYAGTPGEVELQMRAAMVKP
jgi:hypothetical protein